MLFLSLCRRFANPILFIVVLVFQVFVFVSPVSAVADEPSSFPSILLAQLGDQQAPDPFVEYKGPEDSIRQFLCAPAEKTTGIEFYECISRLYRFGISAGALSLVFFVVLAGYFYIVGGEQSKAKGKAILASAITGMAILLGSYVLLRFINPNLAGFRVIQPPIFNAQLPKCEDIGFEANCVISTGSSSGQTYYAGQGGVCSPSPAGSPASINNLKNTCWGQFGDAVVRQASIVAMRESNGNPALPVGERSCPNNTNSRCDGNKIPVVGLFQINLTVHKVAGLDCPAAYTGEWTCSRGCRVRDDNLYQKCVAAAKDPKNNIDVACRIYREAGNTFKPWGNKANEHGKKCGF